MSRALRVRMPTKPNNTRAAETTTPNNNRFGAAIDTSQASMVIAEPLSCPKRKAAMRATPRTQPSQKQKTPSPSITESNESMALTQTCPEICQQECVPSRQKRGQMLIEQQLKNKSIISTIKNSADQNQETESSDFQVGTCSPCQPNLTQYYFSPNYEGPDTSLTVRKAECASDSEMD